MKDLFFRFFCLVLLALNVVAGDNPCIPEKDALPAFKMIEENKLGNLLQYLVDHSIPKDALNENCEDLYMAAIRSKNDLARQKLDSIDFGPVEPYEVNKESRIVLNDMPSLNNLNYYEYALLVGNIETIKYLEGKQGKLSPRRVNSHFSKGMIASFRNSLDVIQFLVNSGTKLYDVNSFSENMFMIAVRKNNLEVINFLMSRDAHIVDLFNRNGRNAFLLAIENNASNIVKVLLNAGVGANTQTQDRWRQTGLMLASGRGDIATIKLLIAAGADVNAKDGHYVPESALNIAVRKNDKNVVRVLLDSGANVDCYKFHGSPFEVALKANSVEVIAPLTATGCDINHVYNKTGGEDEESFTILLKAARSSSRSMIQELVRLGANINSTSHEVSPLIRAACYNSVEVVDFFIKAGAKIDNDVLAYAARYNSVEVIKKLIEAGADVNDHSGVNGWSVLFGGVSSSRKEVVETLLLAGAKVDYRDFDGWNALMLAAAIGSPLNIMKTLVSFGASKNSMNNRGSTAYCIAISEKRSQDVLDFLKPLIPICL